MLRLGPESLRVVVEATLESTSKREEQLRQLDELLEQSGEIKD